MWGGIAMPEWMIALTLDFMVILILFLTRIVILLDKINDKLGRR